jgi:hypothetical protein
MSDLSPLCPPRRTSPVRSKFTVSRRRFPWRAVGGPSCESDLRSFPVGNYIVFCRALPDVVEAVRVTSGRQDIDADDMA